MDCLQPVALGGRWAGGETATSRAFPAPRSRLRGSGVSYRMVHSPHEDAEQRIAGPEELDFLGHEVLLLGLGLTRHNGHDITRGRHGSR